MTVSSSPRLRNYIYTDSDDFKVVTVNGQKRIYISAEPEDTAGVNWSASHHGGSELACDSCHQGVPLVSAPGEPEVYGQGSLADGVRVDIRFQGSFDVGDKTASVTRFYHARCLPDAFRAALHDYPGLHGAPGCPPASFSYADRELGCPGSAFPRVAVHRVLGVRLRLVRPES